MFRSTYEESKERIRMMLLLFAVEGFTEEVMVATIAAFVGAFTGLTSPSPTLPAMSELKDKMVFSLFLVQLNTPNNRIRLIKLENRSTYQ